MIIQLNTDNNIDENEMLEVFVNTSITDELARFKDNITRVKVHLSDKSVDKSGMKDKRCMLEASLGNREPIAVVCNSDTIEHALFDTLEKLNVFMKTTESKLKYR